MLTEKLGFWGGGGGGGGGGARVRSSCSFILALCIEKYVFF